LLNKVCTPAPAFCIQAGFRVASTTAAQTQTVNSAASVDWLMGVGAFIPTMIFANGFE